MGVACLGAGLAPIGCGAAADPAQDTSLETASAGESAATTTQAVTASFPIDPRKSILITDSDIVSTFTLQDVLNQLVTQSGVPGLTALQLFQQMFDTERTATAPGAGPGPHCTPDAADTAAFGFFEPNATAGSINGWPAQCPRHEGDEALSNPFAAGAGGAAYMATTLSNRFDLAPPDGSNCGEYRVNFARVSGITESEQRNFIAFEARLPNPTPSKGLAACAPVVQFWRSLSDPSLAPSTRASMLKSFYFTGLPGFEPVLQYRHYAGPPTSGQVRVNQFLFIDVAGGDWSPREFQLVKSCATSPCTLQMIPHADTYSPAGPLFDPTNTDPRAVDFQTNFLPSTVARLALNDVNAFNFATTPPNQFATADDQIINNFSDFSIQFAKGGSSNTFRTNLQQKLTSIGSSLAPEDVVARAMSLSCAGCHLKSLGVPLGGSQELPPTTGNEPLEATQGFVQVAENTEPVPGDTTGRTRFFAQPALTNTFLPYRQQVMNDFLSPVPGFERAGAWTSSQVTPSQASAPVSQGSASLQVVPALGWTELDSAPFSTTGLAPIGSTMSLDVDLPTHQTNASWHGTVTAFIAIPSAGIANVQIGQVALNGLALGKFVPVSFTLPAAVQSALALGVNDVSVRLQLNVTPNTSPYFLDNLRFH